MTRYDDILARLREAKGLDRFLDWNIQDATGAPSDFAADWGRGGQLTAYPYTASIDAALDLVEKMLPGWDYRLGSQDDEHPHRWLWAEVFPPDWDGEEATRILCNAPTLPIAILIALFIALASKE